MKNLVIVIVIVFGLFSVGFVSAEPRTVVTTISKMRPYSSGAYFVTLASNQLTTGTCTTVYQVKADAAGAKSVIASLLTAYALGESIQIEIPTATGCEGFGTPIQSVFMAG